MSMKISFQRAVMAALSVSIFACGGGGGGGGGGGTAAPAASSTVFIADSSYAAIGSQINGNPPAGVFVVDRVINGASTGLNTSLNGLAIDSVADRLFVTQGTSIRVFDNAGLANGNVTSRLLSELVPGGYRSPFLDKTNDRLYVANLFDSLYTNTASVFVFNNASTASMATPARTITSDFGGTGRPTLYSVAVDLVKNKLYALVKSQYTVGGLTYVSYVRVAVFNNASTLNGTYSPDYFIDIGANSEAGTVTVDAARDQLYVSSYSAVYVFDSASTLSSPTAPTRSIAFPGPLSMLKAAVDLKNDRLYAMSGDKVFIVDNARTANGSMIGKQLSVSGIGSLTAIAVKQ